jgi:hypothetical protein
MASVSLGEAHKLVRSGRRFSRKLLRFPLERSARRLVAQALSRGPEAPEISDRDAYVSFSAPPRICSLTTVGELLRLGEAWKSDSQRASDDDFPINLLRSADVLTHRAFRDIALHDEILAAVTRYFGQVPRLFNLSLWWSPPNQTVKGSQLYHYDHRDSRQAKLFLNLNEVTHESGPLHFLSASNSLKVDATVGYSQGRYTDEQVYSACPRSQVLATTGAPGSAFLVDTARCLHYGSRGNARDRFVLMASFARVNSVAPGSGCEVLDPLRERLVREFYRDDPVRSFVLDAPR